MKQIYFYVKTNCLIIFCLLLLHSCLHLPENEELLAAEPQTTWGTTSGCPIETNQFQSCDGEKEGEHGFSFVPETENFLGATLDGGEFSLNSMGIDPVPSTTSIHYFEQNGLRIGIAKFGSAGSEAILKVDNLSADIAPISGKITLVIQFKNPIDKGVEFLQVVSGVDSITRSVEYDQKMLLTEFHLGENMSGNALQDFSFGMYFRAVDGNLLPPLNEIIDYVEISPGGIEITIVDNGYCESHGGNDPISRARSISSPMEEQDNTPALVNGKAVSRHQEWNLVSQILYMYIHHYSTDIIQEQVQEYELNMHREVDFTFGFENR